MLTLKDKVVVITGAASGLGKALAAAFCAEGCHLALIDIDKAALDICGKELAGSGRLVTTHLADVSVENDVIRAVDEIAGRYRQVHILINNAGISISQSFATVALPDFKRLVEVNFWGTVYCSRYFLPHLQQQAGSRLVNIVSIFASAGFPGKTAYGASKSAIVGFTNSLRTELERDRPALCIVIPPAMDTNIVTRGVHTDEEKRQKEIQFLQKNGMDINGVAAKIVKGVRKGKYCIVIGGMTNIVDIIARVFPSSYHRMAGRYKNNFDFI